MSEQIGLPELIHTQPPGSPTPVAFYATPVMPQQEFKPEAPAVPLSHYLWILGRHFWKIVAFVATCMVATLIVSARLKPVYESTATVDVDRQAPSELVGQDSTRSTAPNDADQFLATQVRLIQSDAVLRPVAEQYQLLRLEGQLNKVKPEKVRQIFDAPIKLKQLKVARPPNTYLLLISYRSPDPDLAARVANSIATSYLNHSYDIRIRSSASLSLFMERQLDELKAKMERSSLALAQFEKDLDVVNPEEKTNILSARLLQLNTEYTQAQADRVQKEAAWNAIRSGAVEAAQVSSQGESLARLTETLNEARQRFAQIKSTYDYNHPEYRKAASELAEIQRQFDDTAKDIRSRVEVEYHESLDREQMLQQSVAQTKSEWDQLNSRSFQYQQLKREADTDKELYDELIRKIREADINAGFQNNNVRIADLARPATTPVLPNTKLNLLLALLISTLVAIGAAVLHDSLDTTLRDPAEASRFLGTDVIGVLPNDRNAVQLPRRPAPGGELIPLTTTNGKNGSNGHYTNGHYPSISGFEEAVRTLRNTILLSDFEHTLRSIVLTSATASEGKTTVAAHLAIANADRGRRTLLVDGDLRRPGLHVRFGLSPKEGLSTVLTGETDWQDAVLPIEGKPNLRLLPSGPSSHRAADLIGPRLAELLDEFGKHYDLVILDSPPLLGFAECLQMATAADGVLIVTRAGVTTRKGVSAVVSALARLRANLLGVVLNQVRHNTSAEGYSYYGYYRYRYESERESES
jgi:succinoglycan biosynthesis transport protein ExoP